MTRELHLARSLSESSPGMARAIAIVCRNLVHQQSALLTIGRFEVVRTLGRGGTGFVYEVHDPVRDERVALKVLHARGPNALYRLKREFRTLAEVHHPSLVALHELFIHGSEACFTMELVKGCNLVEHVRRGGASALSRLVAALDQLCQGVRALHRAGKLHRDLKPSNVLVTDEGRVVLLDFGLADDARRNSQNGAGTAAYMAPEQARGAACESSDWFSVGRILEVTLDALPVRASHDAVARARLADLARALVRRDPSARPSYGDIVALLSGRTTGVGGARSEPAAHAPSAAARERLMDAYRRARTQPVLVVLEGARGVGKSALLRRFASELRSEAWALEGRCHEREVVPYKALDEAIDELSRLLLALPADHPVRHEAVVGGALTELFPVLGRVAWLHGRAGDRSQAVAELRAMLAGLARDRPLVLCIDDLHWSDEDSGWLLGALLCGESAPPLLVVATARRDGASTSAAERSFERFAERASQRIVIERVALP